MRDRDVAKMNPLEHRIYRFVNKNYTKPFDINDIKVTEGAKVIEHVYNYIAKRFIALELSSDFRKTGLVHDTIANQFQVIKPTEELKPFISKSDKQDKFNFNNSFENHMKALRN